MGILEIERTRSATGSDAFRAYKIFIDGNQVDEIKSGESKRIELSEGEHMLQLKIDWCTSKEVRFSITTDNTTRAKCYPAGKGFMSMINMFAKKNEYITVEML